MLLKQNSTGEDVKKIQAVLGIPTTGIFDLNTKTKVMLWQKTNRLVVDGLVGNATWGLMFPAIIYDSASLGILTKLNNLKGIIPNKVLLELPLVLNTYEINEALPIAHFLAQCSEESANFTRVYENLNYGRIQLKKIFGKYFTEKEIKAYAGVPQLIANRVYANRMGNGSEASGDGWKYRGRGNIQLTGEYMYDLFSEFIHEDCVSNPDLVATKYPLVSAAFFFKLNNIWEIANNGSSAVVIKSVTRKINPGLLGLENRILHFKKYYPLLLQD